jgi:hypothetical protein
VVVFLRAGALTLIACTEHCAATINRGHLELKIPRFFWYKRRRASGKTHRKGESIMLVVMEKAATQEQIDKVVNIIEARGMTARPIPAETASPSAFSTTKVRWTRR